MDDSPRILPSVVDVEEPDSPVELYRGPLRISMEGGDRNLEGSLSLHLVPRPMIRFEGDLPGPWPAGIVKHPVKLRADGFLPETQAWVASASYGGEGPHPIWGYLGAPAFRGDPDSAIDEVRFALTNFPGYKGSKIYDPESRIRSYQRLVFVVGGFEVTVDGEPGRAEAERQVLRSNGHLFSHRGRIRKIDGSAFLVEEGKALLECLAFWFAFSAGRWTGPVLSTGFRDGSLVWQDLDLPPLDRFLGGTAWLPRFTDLDFGGTVDRMWSLWNKSEWQRAMKHVIGWYRLAQTSGVVETPIVLGQTALELLSWMVLVEGGHISGEGFNRIKAEDRLRLLGGHLRLPTGEIPSAFKVLRSFGAGLNAKDVPTVLTLVRNAMVHPTPKHLTQLESYEAVLEASELAIAVLEQSVLAILGYAGVFTDRTREWRKDGVTGDAPVPWAAPS
ncbi:hypothetical protein WI372_11630 [Gemmatimonadota bacterium DH-20]|uniref:YopA central domain-containing protein n=1 Tax=Gaopeijia maritima TaxID=3119007 RepID=A0ABU9EA66_9BACT